MVIRTEGHSCPPSYQTTEGHGHPPPQVIRPQNRAWLCREPPGRMAVKDAKCLLPWLILSLKNFCQLCFPCHSIASLVLILFFKITHHY